MENALKLSGVYTFSSFPSPFSQTHYTGFWFPWLHPSWICQCGKDLHVGYSSIEFEVPSGLTLQQNSVSCLVSLIPWFLLYCGPPWSFLSPLLLSPLRVDIGEPGMAFKYMSSSHPPPTNSWKHCVSTSHFRFNSDRRFTLYISKTEFLVLPTSLLHLQLLLI